MIRITAASWHARGRASDLKYIRLEVKLEELTDHDAGAEYASRGNSDDYGKLRDELATFYATLYVDSLSQRLNLDCHGRS